MAETDTPEVNDIPAILARADAATEGPWSWMLPEGDFGEIDIRAGDRSCLGEITSGREDARFVAHSRTDVPNMAAEILSLRAQLKDAEKTVEAARDIDSWIYSPGGIKQGLLEVIAEVAGVHANHLVALHEAIEAADADGEVDPFVRVAEAIAEVERREKENG